jgi:hypothetical protein
MNQCVFGVGIILDGGSESSLQFRGQISSPASLVLPQPANPLFILRRKIKDGQRTRKSFTCKTGQAAQKIKATDQGKSVATFPLLLS